jgi:hypothetical protein
MHGLTVRWSLDSSDADVMTKLRDYVRDSSHARFTTNAPSSPGSEIVGASPVLIEPCEIVAVAEGASGFLARATYEDESDPT